ncbi:MAG: FIST signal transduction protein [Myxococcaceae bacterium]
MRLSIGRSEAANPKRAAAQAVAGALRNASHPAGALVMSTDQYDAAELAAAVSQELGDIPWAGGYTAGVFTGPELVRHGIVVGALCGADAWVGVGVAGPVSRGARSAGERAAALALEGMPEQREGRGRSMILLVDALTGNAAEAVRGAAREAGVSFTWAGGSAGDNLRFARAAQFANGRAYVDHVAALAIETSAPIRAGIRHGWRPYGLPTMVTQTRGSTVVQLEYEQAFQVYRRTAASRGEQVSEEGFAVFAMTHPLGIPQANGDYVIRDPLEVDEDGGLRCLAEVPDGCMVRVMEGDREALIEAARAVAKSAREAVQGQLGGAIVFDCVSRFLMLGKGFDEELAVFRETLGASVPLMGCLTFGEVGGAGGTVPQFHNKTSVVLAMTNQAD